jgi:hypothetical protein
MMHTYEHLDLNLHKPMGVDKPKHNSLKILTMVSSGKQEVDMTPLAS